MPRKTADEPTVTPALDRWSFKKRAPMDELGLSGLVRFGVDVHDEWHLQLRGPRGVKVFREIHDNEPTVGASMFAIEALIRKVPWMAEPADHPQGEEAAEFVTQMYGDMSHTWQDFLAEAFVSMLVFGWAYFEKVWKLRVGPAERDPRMRSKYSDGRLAVRKIAIRAQETLDGWEFDEDGGIKGMYQVAAPEYARVFIPIEKSVLYRPKQSKNNPEGRSILRPAYRPWFFLKRMEELEAIGMERDLVGLAKMELPVPYFASNAPADKKAAIAAWQTKVSQIRRNEHEGIVVPSETLPDGKPSGYKLSLMTTGGTRTLDIAGAISRKQKSIAQTMLTQFLFLGMDKVGAQALSVDMTELFEVSLTVLLDLFEETTHRFITSEAMEMNGFPVEAWPRWKHADVEKKDVTPLAKALLDLVDGGVITPDAKLEDFIRNEMRLPERETPEERAEREGRDPGDDGDKDPLRGGEGEDGASARTDAANTIDKLTAAIAKCVSIGDVDMANHLRNALAAMLGVEPPPPLKPKPEEDPDDEEDDPPRPGAGA